jgi:hypothetical protein
MPKKATPPKAGACRLKAIVTALTTHHLAVARGVYPVVADADVGLAEDDAADRQVDAGGQGGGGGEDRDGACGFGVYMMMRAVGFWGL